MEVAFCKWPLSIQSWHHNGGAASRSEADYSHTPFLRDSSFAGGGIRPPCPPGPGKSSGKQTDAPDPRPFEGIPPQRALCPSHEYTGGFLTGFPGGKKRADSIDSRNQSPPIDEGAESGRNSGKPGWPKKGEGAEKGAGPCEIGRGAPSLNRLSPFHPLPGLPQMGARRRGASRLSLGWSGKPMGPISESVSSDRRTLLAKSLWESEMLIWKGGKCLEYAECWSGGRELLMYSAGGPYASAQKRRTPFHHHPSSCCLSSPGTALKCSPRPAKVALGKREGPGGKRGPAGNPVRTLAPGGVWRG